MIIFSKRVKDIWECPKCLHIHRRGGWDEGFESGLTVGNILMVIVVTGLLLCWGVLLK